MSWPFILTALFSIGFALAGVAYLTKIGLSLDLRYNGRRLRYLGSGLRQNSSNRLSRNNIGNPWQSSSLIWRDRFFGFILGRWMLLGMGNLIALPVRIEYLANPKFDVNASNTTIAVLMLVVIRCRSSAQHPYVGTLLRPSPLCDHAQPAQPVLSRQYRVLLFYDQSLCSRSCNGSPRPCVRRR